MTAPTQPTDWLDLNNLPDNLSRQEREYLEFKQQQRDDASIRHRTIVTCWDADTRTYREKFILEPTDETFVTIIGEALPIWLRTKVSPFCTCPERYQHVLLALDATRSATQTVMLTKDTLTTLKQEQAISRAVAARLKPITGHIFFSQQDSTRAIVSAVQGLLTPKQQQEVGPIILAAFTPAGIDEDYRQKRIAELEDQLDEWHGVAPVKPFPPTKDPCPHCHFPYSYELWELLPSELSTILRILRLLTGGSPIPLSELEHVFSFLEHCLFADDGDLLKKNTAMRSQTLVSLGMADLHRAYHEMKQKLLQQLANNAAPAPDSTDSVTSSSDAAPPPPPDSIPDAS
jgi:hypothetical protein